jgi:hypothetical protein
MKSLLKQFWKQIIAVGGILAAVIFAVIAAGEYHRKAKGVREALKVERAKQRIKSLRAEKDSLVNIADSNQERIDAIDEQLQENATQIKRVREASNIPAKDLVREFRELGY